ncbi:MAG: hypothetical protein ACLSAF_05770 [Intestinimonas sp.]
MASPEGATDPRDGYGRRTSLCAEFTITNEILQTYWDEVCH